MKWLYSLCQEAQHENQLVTPDLLSFRMGKVQVCPLNRRHACNEGLVFSHKVIENDKDWGTCFLSLLMNLSEDHLLHLLLQPHLISWTAMKKVAESRSVTCLIVERMDICQGAGESLLCNASHKVNHVF
jgi:hypothetical protein